MRPKFVLLILLAGVLAIGAVFFLKPHSSPPAPDIAPVPAVSAAPAPEPAPAPAPMVVKKTATPEEREAAIDAETDRLSSWAMNDDAQSLSNILADLTNPEKEIRDAAIDAAEQFGSTNAIPALKAVAANTTDTEEQIALLEAANFLSLPSFTIGGSGPAVQRTPEQIQIDAQEKADHDAHRQAQLDKLGGNRNSQSASDPNSPPAHNH
jgi:hypothetical protein